MNKKILIYIVIVFVALTTVIASFNYFGSSKNNTVPLNKEIVPMTTTLPISTSSLPQVDSKVVTPEITSTATSPAVTSSKKYDVIISNFSFNPGVLNINKGDTVTWTNKDGAPHQITGGDLNGGTMSKGQTYTFVFSKTGTFDYHCSIHPSMKGTIVVK